MNYFEPLQPGSMYHITAHAIGNEKLFLTDENYRFFLQRYQKYISPVANTFAYALLPNHIHLLLQIKADPELQQHYKTIKPHGKMEQGWQPDFIMQRFSNLFNSYAKSFNKKYNRKGSLFINQFRRVQVISDAQYTATVFYIHKNPVHHGICKSMEGWPWSSFNGICTNSTVDAAQQQVLEWFGGIEKFIAYHDQPVYLKNAVAVEY